MTLRAALESRDPRFRDPAFLDALQVAVAAATSEAMDLTFRPQDVRREVTEDRGKVRVAFSAEVVDGKVNRSRRKAPTGTHPEARDLAVAMAPAE